MKNPKLKYYQAIYLACRALLPPEAQNDEEVVKALRDHECWERFNKTVSELNISELNLFCDVLNGKTPEQKFATPRQIKQLQYYMLACALKFANFKELEYINVFNGEIISGENLRRALLDAFYTDKATKSTLPKNIVFELYTNWINPKTNTLLMQGGHKDFVRNPNMCYYERLSQEAVAYLINRYSLMHNNSVNKYTQVQPVCAN